MFLLLRLGERKSRKTCIVVRQAFRLYQLVLSRYPLCDGHDRSSFEHGITFADVDGSHGPVVGGLYDILHLHGLEYCNLLALFYGVSRLYRDFDDHSRERCRYRFAFS